MAFYIQPPMGGITISQLENWAVKRLQFLLDIFGCHGNMDAVKQLMESPLSVEKSDCLIEGTTKDAVSHFILRLACAGDVLTTKVFVESETVLFLYRFTSLSEAELLRYLGCLRRFQKQLTKHLQPVDPENVSLILPPVIMDICQFFKMLTETFDWRTLIHHYSLKSEEHFVHLPFKFALEMVAKRQVVLNRGKAVVPCSLLPQLFRWFFHSWLTYGIHLAKTQHGRFIEDSRMKRISAMCKSLIQRRCHSFDAGRGFTVLSSLVASDIDHLVKGFPPCMIRLHESLRKNHRLKHYSRIVYILFLKELGLPVNEAVSFWRQEYSRPFPVSSSYHGCRHLWHKEEKRLTYSIHHLYGFKGSRQKYSSHTCAYIQNHDWGPAEEAFCPFYQSDSLKLQQSLASNLPSTAVWSRIHELVERKQPCMACSVFLAAKTEHHMPGAAKDPCSDGISAEEVCSGEEISTADKALLGCDKNSVSQTNISCGCAKDSSILSPSTNCEVNQFLETRNDDEMMMETDLPSRLQSFKKRRTSGCLKRSLHIDSHERPKPSVGLEKEMNRPKSNSCEDIFSSENGFVLTQDSGYDSSPLLSSTEFQPGVLSNSDHSSLCYGDQLVKRAMAFNPQDKVCHCKVKIDSASTAYQQKFQLVEKKTNAADYLLRVAVDTPKAVNQNTFNTDVRVDEDSRPTCRRKAHQNLKLEINSSLKNQHKATGSDRGRKRQSSVNRRALMFESIKTVSKPVDFFQSYNDLVKQFRKECAIALS